MRIGIIGTRGIPNQYGGYEQFVEFAAPELVKRGHEVYVYNSSLHPFKEPVWKGVNIISKYDPENRLGTAGQFIYDLNCIQDARKRNYDVILQLGYTSSSIWSFRFPKDSVLITNMDGLEWKRTKYSKKVQSFLRRAEKWGVLYSDYLIADSKGIQQYLREKYNKESNFIAYGAQLAAVSDEALIRQWGQEKYSYNLLIARMEPENNVETVIRAHLATARPAPLVIIGNYNNGFGTYLKEKYAHPLIQFLGPIYNLEHLNSLRAFSRLYFHGHSVGGTNPSLLEAMASYSLIVAHDNVFNKSVLEEDGFYFSNEQDIVKLLDQDFNKTDYDFMINNNTEKIRTLYSWDHIINLLENLFIHAVEASGHKKR